MPSHFCLVNKNEKNVNMYVYVDTLIYMSIPQKLLMNTYGYNEKTAKNISIILHNKYLEENSDVIDKSSTCNTCKPCKTILLYIVFCCVFLIHCLASSIRCNVEFVRACNIITNTYYVDCIFGNPVNIFANSLCPLSPYSCFIEQKNLCFI